MIDPALVGAEGTDSLGRGMRKLLEGWVHAVYMGKTHQVVPLRLMQLGYFIGRILYAIKKKKYAHMANGKSYHTMSRGREQR